MEFFHRVIEPFRGLAFNAPDTLSHLLADNATPPLLRAYAGFAFALRLAPVALGSHISAVRFDEAVSSLFTAEHLAKQVNPRELSDLVLGHIEQHSESIIWGKACWLRVPHTILRLLAEKRLGKWINAMVRAKSHPNEITKEVNALLPLHCLI